MTLRKHQKRAWSKKVSPLRQVGKPLPRHSAQPMRHASSKNGPSFDSSRYMQECAGLIVGYFQLYYVVTVFLNYPEAEEFQILVLSEAVLT